MTSFNHYALGSVVAWLYRALAGFREYSPADAQLAVAPHFASQLDHVTAHVTVPQGVARTTWHRVDADTVRLSLEVPEGLTVRIALPGHEATLSEGEHQLDVCVPPQTKTDFEVSLDTPLGDLIELEHAPSLIARVLDGEEAGRGTRFIECTQWVECATLAGALGEESPAVQQRVLDALREASAG